MPKETELKIDPVCKMSVDPKSARSFSFENENFFFCSEKCLTRFKASPVQFVRPPASGQTSASGSTEIYTCPMHPQIEKQGPGSCPICGMALEPKIMSEASHEDQSEYLMMLKRFWICTALSAPLLLLTMLIRPLMGESGWKGLQWVELALASPVVLWGAVPFFERFWQSLKNKSPNMFTLIGLGVSISYLYSIVALLFPEIFPNSFRDSMTHEIGLYFEAASVIVTLVLLGQVLELKARGQTSAAIRSLLALSPKTARRVRDDGTDEEIATTEIRVGDQIRVRPGEKVAVDGVILFGHSFIDESMVTGESIPSEKKIGSSVIGATINSTGSFIFEAKKVGQETLLSQIVQMVSSAQRSRAPIQKLVDQISAYFVPVVVLSSILTLAAWAIFGPEPRWAFAVVNAVAVLIVACPCALGLATPMSIMVTTGQAAKSGILFRNAEAIENLRKLDTLIVDKTGTLTIGKPQVVSVLPFNRTEVEVLTWAASLEKSSEHPIAAAILAKAKLKNIVLKELSHFESISGQGAVAEIEGKKILVGNKLLMEQNKIDVSHEEDKANKLRRNGETLIYIAYDGILVGLIGVMDPIKETSLAAVEALQKRKIKVVMVTGDHEINAQITAEKTKVDQFFAGVLPAHKAEIIKSLQNQNHFVGMAGDGINDAPALAQAQVGIAMGTGTDIAMNTAGVILVKGDLTSILKAIQYSENNQRNIQQNLFFAFVYNALGIPVAAGVLYPHFGILLSPMIAAAAMSFSSVSVITNALRLKKMQS